MKTFLPKEINTKRGAEQFLKILFFNGESFHPEDNPNEVVWSCEKPTKKELKQLAKLMEDISKIQCFDPCDYLLSLEDIKTETFIDPAGRKCVNEVIEVEGYKITIRADAKVNAAVIYKDGKDIKYICGDIIANGQEYTDNTIEKAINWINQNK